jgi:hypothetical protein
MGWTIFASAIAAGLAIILFVLLTDGRYSGKRLMYRVYDSVGAAVFSAHHETERWRGMLRGLAGDAVETRKTAGRVGARAEAGWRDDPERVSGAGSKESCAGTGLVRAAPGCTGSEQPTSASLSGPSRWGDRTPETIEGAQVTDEIGVEMDACADPIQVGFQMLHESKRPLLRARIIEQISLAREPWTRAFETLADYPQVRATLDGLCCQVLPYLIKGCETSPVHHTACVVGFMAQIATSDQKLSHQDVRRGLVAALLHDIGLGDTVLPKITEEMIEKAPESQKARLCREGIAARREHMEKGKEISRRLLERYQSLHPHALSDDDIAVILEIVGTHDNNKIPLMADTVEKKWLLAPTDDDCLKQCHWEADALWMLSPAGILIDLAREQEKDTPENRRKKFYFNLGLHRDIVTMYRQACSQEEMEQFGFRDGLLYRTWAGYALAMNFKKQADRL